MSKNKSSSVLFLYIRQFEADAFLLVDGLQHEAEDEGSHTQTGEHHQWGGIVELRRVGHTWVRGVEHLADEQGEQPEADVLDPENQGVGRTDHFSVDELRH